jgi:urease accessory protein
MTIARSMRMLQFGDTLLPVGSFAFSSGLESAVQLGEVNDAVTLAQFVRTGAHRAATCDGIALLAAYRGAAAADLRRVRDADHAVMQRKLSEEARTMTTRMGRKLAEAATQTASAPVLTRWLAMIRAGAVPGTYPVGIGVLFADLRSPESDAFAVHQYGLAMNLLSAALRLMRVDHIQVQEILYRVDGVAEADYAEVRNAALSDMASFAPMTDVLAAIHARSDIRLFMS